MADQTRPARGMRDFLPDDVRRREYVVGVIERTYRRYGFEPLETPALENIETLTGKYGEEGNKLIFKVLRRGEHEASGEADLALRYDLTVPLARVVAEHRGKLPRFFKRYQIQPVWRADRPARGRFREFYQCDVDAIGSTSPIVEAEVCSAVSDVLRELGFRDFVIRVNHRGLLKGMLEMFGVPVNLHDPALVAVDKLDKIGRDGVSGELAGRGIPASAAEKLLAAFDHPLVRSPSPEPSAHEAMIAWAREQVRIASRRVRGRGESRRDPPAVPRDECRRARRARPVARARPVGTTRARSWRRRCPISGAASVAAAATTA